VRLAIFVFAAMGLVGAIATALLFTLDPERVAAAMCAAWWLGLTIAIGALGAIMTLDVTHATWFVFFRSLATSIAAAMPILALGLLPAALVAHHVYPWAGAERGISDEVLTRIARTRPWMSPWPIYVRTLVSLGVWSTLAIWLNTKAKNGRARVTGAIGLPLLFITATVTPFDWLMVVEPGWTSSIYGLYVLISGFYGATALLSTLAWLAHRHGRIGAEVRPAHFHALGRLMLTAVCLWGYLGFFQLMLQWIGNLPAEVGFWVRRGSGPWGVVSAVLVVGQFVVPFFLLLSRPLKRIPNALACVGGWMLVMHVVDVEWLVLPSRAPAPFASALAPLAAVVGLSAAWALWRASTLSQPLTRDPDFIRGARYESP
jgi:hypothetical protein